MKTRTFDGQKIKIRKVSKKDLQKVKKFQNFINSLIEEEAKISSNKKLSLREERKWLEATLKDVKEHSRVFLVAEYNNIIIGTTSVSLSKGRMSHVGNFGITIREGYRRIGLGRHLTAEILKLAQKELKPEPKIIRLNVHSNNKPAIALYRKFGFKKVAAIPKQIAYKEKLFDEIIMLLDL